MKKWAIPNILFCLFQPPSEEISFVSEFEFRFGGLRYLRTVSFLTSRSHQEWIIQLFIKKFQSLRMINLSKLNFRIVDDYSNPISFQWDLSIASECIRTDVSIFRPGATVLCFDLYSQQTYRNPKPFLTNNSFNMERVQLDQVSLVFWLLKVSKSSECHTVPWVQIRTNVLPLIDISAQKHMHTYPACDLVNYWYQLWRRPDYILLCIFCFSISPQFFSPTFFHFVIPSIILEVFSPPPTNQSTKKTSQTDRQITYYHYSKKIMNWRSIVR